jgi:hypothetical protein
LHTTGENLLIVPPAKAGKLMNYYASAGGEPWLRAASQKFERAWLPPIYALSRARIFAEAKIFLAGENRAVLRETRLEKDPLIIP